MKWGVVVGQPKSEGWNDTQPDLSNVGQWVVSGMSRADYEVVLFDTQQLAQEEASKMSETNSWWNYDVKEYVVN
jgi:hypothetical protein